ncbi:MAG TPA: cysteine--tRNA ligase, partial [Gammaproteobacteria bacterium]|nr:cysteine--tRNA ligase [Gammaproteobacteria bacterium]
MPDIYLHNTLTGSKELFVPVNPECVTIYVCGPTVYDLAHIGNARPPVVFDVLVRLLSAAYPAVKYVANITDIDD